MDMKAFKGCTNPSCKAYKKIQYKAADEYCKKCGSKLNYVCSECWMILQDNKSRLCEGCKTKKGQKKQGNFDKAKNVGEIAAGGLTAAAAGIAFVANNSEKIVDNTVKIIKAGEKIIRVINK